MLDLWTSEDYVNVSVSVVVRVVLLVVVRVVVVALVVSVLVVAVVATEFLLLRVLALMPLILQHYGRIMDNVPPPYVPYALRGCACVCFCVCLAGCVCVCLYALCFYWVYGCKRRQRVDSTRAVNLIATTSVCVGVYCFWPSLNGASHSAWLVYHINAAICGSI